MFIGHRGLSSVAVERGQLGPRPLQGAVHRRHRGVEHGGDLDRGPAQDVGQQQHGALARRQLLDRRDERETDGLAQLVAGVRPCGGIRQALQLGVGIGLDPQRFCIRPPLRPLGRRAVQLVGHHPAAPRTARHHVEGHVRRDPVEPVLDRGARLEVVEAPPRPQHGFLDRVLGLVQRPEHAIAVQLERAAMRLGHPGEVGAAGRSVACRADERLVFHGDTLDFPAAQLPSWHLQLAAATPSAEMVKIDPASAGGFTATSRTASATSAGDCRGPMFSRNFSAGTPRYRA